MEIGLINIHGRAVCMVAMLAAAGVCAAQKAPEDNTSNSLYKTVGLDEVSVMASGTQTLKKSAYNVLAVDAKAFANTSKSIADVLNQIPGVKLRETGGVGADTQLMLDGFTGRHVKVFIDGVPQDGGGKAFDLNNIPVNYAERIEVYKGVVPVQFATDAIGGVVNIVTKQGKRDGWALDASYTGGSFNTHRSFADFSHRLKGGFFYHLNAFQNYSDNGYRVDASVKDFQTGAIDKKNKQSVKRFHDTFHNESAGFKAGWAGTGWADKLQFGLTYAQSYKDIQTGVRQDVVFGQKHRRGHSLMPRLEYRKRNLFAKGLEAVATAGYDLSVTENVDTASYRYNWIGQRDPLKNRRGEQDEQHSRSVNHTANGNLTLNYRIGAEHLFTLNHLVNTFTRRNTSLLNGQENGERRGKVTTKNITGLSYRFMPSEKWNVSAFAKHYAIYTSGLVGADANGQGDTLRTSSRSHFGFGLAGTYFFTKGLQAKLSYERALRLPTVDELFGDEDMEQGDISLRPERSHNLNLNFAYSVSPGAKHHIYAEGGFVFRSTEDYIMRNIFASAGNRNYFASYMNYGKVMTKGVNLSAEYRYADIFSAGGNFTYMDVADNEKTMFGSNQANIGYGAHMPNIPYLFADFNAALTIKNALKRGNKLTISYSMPYQHSFTLYSERIGNNQGDYLVPEQLSHNLSATYSMARGRYNLTVEGRNLTNAKLYDNFSLQKPGRAIYVKFRVNLHG